MNGPKIMRGGGFSDRPLASSHNHCEGFRAKEGMEQGHQRARRLVSLVVAPGRPGKLASGGYAKMDENRFGDPNSPSLRVGVSQSTTKGQQPN